MKKVEKPPTYKPISPVQAAKHPRTTSESSEKSQGTDVQDESAQEEPVPVGPPLSALDLEAMAAQARLQAEAARVEAEVLASKVIMHEHKRTTTTLPSGVRIIEERILTCFANKKRVVTETVHTMGNPQECCRFCTNQD